MIKAVKPCLHRGGTTKARPGEKVFDLQHAGEIQKIFFPNYPNMEAWFSTSESKHFIIFIFPIRPREAAHCSLSGGSV